MNFLSQLHFFVVFLRKVCLKIFECLRLAKIIACLVSLEVLNFQKHWLDSPGFITCYSRLLFHYFFLNTLFLSCLRPDDFKKSRLS